MDEALRFKKRYETTYNRPVDRLWVVFDKDSFSPNDFNSTILRCRDIRPGIGCAWSNEAFELWYLLHFDYYENAMDRKDFKILIENHLKSFNPDFKYEKNSDQMYALLKEYGSQENAFRNAKRLTARFDERQDYSNHNPSTRVWELVEELIKLQ